MEQPRNDPGDGRIHLPALTGLRILAALAVYFSHMSAPPEGAAQTIRTFFSSGYMGVTVFFTLSGFVLALTYVTRLSRPTVSGVYEYFVARFARVYPLYLLVLVYMLVRQRGNGAPLDGWFEHVLAIQAWNPDLSVMASYNSPGWSIGVEFFLYACFPLMIPLLARLRRPRTILLLAGVVAIAMLVLAAWFATTGRGFLSPVDPSSAHRWLYRTPLTRLGDFTLGILAALLFLQLRQNPRAIRLGTPLAVASGVAIVALMVWPAHLHSAWSYDVSYAIPATILIFALAVAPQGRPSRALSTPSMVLFGEASYAFYLVHFPLLVALGAGRFNTEISITNVTFDLLTLGTILALAVGIHILVERPARDWIRRLLMIRRREKNRPPPELPVEEPLSVMPAATSATTTTNS